MLHNIVSPMIVLHMNNQNHTWTNGYGGHVRYNLPLFGDLWQHNQSMHKFAKIDKIEPLTLAWMLTIVQPPLDYTSLLLIFSSYVHT
jgi:hypothetical protein